MYVRVWALVSMQGKSMSEKSLTWFGTRKSKKNGSIHPQLFCSFLLKETPSFYLDSAHVADTCVHIDICDDHESLLVLSVSTLLKKFV